MSVHAPYCTRSVAAGAVIAADASIMLMIPITKNTVAAVVAVAVVAAGAE